MLNFRKIRQDYSPTILKEGKGLYDKGMLQSSKITKLTTSSVRITCKIQGNFENTYTCEIEIDRQASATLDADCDCSYKYDCQHLAALLYHLEDHLNGLIVDYSKEGDLGTKVANKKEKAILEETIREAEHKEVARKGKKLAKELAQEYVCASRILGESPFFLPSEEQEVQKAELLVVFEDREQIEIQLALRLPFRSKPLHVLQLKEFFDALRYEETLYIGNKHYFFTSASFPLEQAKWLKMLQEKIRFPEIKGQERNPRLGVIDPESFGMILADAYAWASKQPLGRGCEEEAHRMIPGFYCGSFEEPLKFSNRSAELHFELSNLSGSSPKLVLKPQIRVDGDVLVGLADVHLFECTKPGLIHQHIYSSFKENIRRQHLRNLPAFTDLIVPEPLFGTFIENSLPELKRFARVSNETVVEKFTTLPFTGKLEAECEINFLNGELDASLTFNYGGIKVSSCSSQLTAEMITPFVTEQGVLARNLVEEQAIIRRLFQDFTYDPVQGLFSTKSEKKIVEFMTELVPNYQNRVKFNCPENLLNQFIYDETTFKLALQETGRMDQYEVDLKVDGALHGMTLDQLWECLSARRSYIELPGKKGAKGGKILVLDLDKLSPVLQIFDEIGVTKLDTHVEQRPLWSLVSIDPSHFEGLPIKFSMTDKLRILQQQMLGLTDFAPAPIPSVIQATPRSYQVEGVNWMERLRHMHLNGVLADDMGLGKTLQAIIALTQMHEKNPKARSLVICPTSLVYNWKEEFTKFNPKLKVLPVDGTPTQRKKLLSDINEYDVVITSYSLLQKDIEIYRTISFAYTILDEAQHIKNRFTRNAKSVKMIQAAHRLILTGTPIENSLDEMWSLFDFLMPGLLSTYDRFIEKYIRPTLTGKKGSLDPLRRKVSPFILRRMKADVVKELPPVSEIIYHCHLTEGQRELYRSYAESAREELSQLVKKEGFERCQIHVLATLTRLKQICCHPAIFAKEKAEFGDSAKYDMLMELLHNLMEGKHKTVIFSQYTRMLAIVREDLERQGIPFQYLDGSSKNRVQIVKTFNEDPDIPFFLVSLKAGGTGLNLVGADTVIHYDLWWNPAIQEQATDRVHRIGQTRSVSSYKLVTLNTIEEKIVELHNRKRKLVEQVVACDEDAISKLTWEEVLELLQT